MPSAACGTAPTYRVIVDFTTRALGAKIYIFPGKNRLGTAQSGHLGQLLAHQGTARVHLAQRVANGDDDEVRIEDEDEREQLEEDVARHGGQAVQLEVPQLLRLVVRHVVAVVEVEAEHVLETVLVALVRLLRQCRCGNLQAEKVNSHLIEQAFATRKSNISIITRFIDLFTIKEGTQTVPRRPVVDDHAVVVLVNHENERVLHLRVRVAEVHVDVVDADEELAEVASSGLVSKKSKLSSQVMNGDN